MGPLMTSELSLDCRFSSEITDEFVARISSIYSESEKISELKAYVEGLQEERKKIDGFPRDLPLIAGLMDEAIVKLSGVLAQCKRSNAKPVLEEFIPLKSSSADENEKFGTRKEKDIVTSTDKRDWLSSVQLGNSDNQNSCPNIDLSSNRLGLKLDNNDKKKSQEDIKRQMTDDRFHIGEKKAVGRAFVPFKGCSNFPIMPVRKDDTDELPIVPGLSLCTPEINVSREDINYNGFSSKSSTSRSGSSSATNGQSQTARKQRRCWSPELHRRFVNALQQLGGAQVATPKQIRELMQVDGLTNDEVKSHLQKYRLHTRKASASTTNTSTVQHLGLWVSQEQCGESSKPSNSQSGSPQGPLHLARSSRGTSMMTGGSMEDEDDEKTESHSWKSDIQLSG